MTYRPHPEAERRIRSATAVIKLVLANGSPEILDKHRRDVIDEMLWKITEADGKLKTRYQSCAALEGGLPLRHEHVFTKKSLIDALLSCRPDHVDEILKTAVGCTVTKEEHDRLTAFDKVCDGWERYRRAKVPVKDTLTGELEGDVES